MSDASAQPESEPAAPPAMFGPHWYGEQDENGVDLSLIRENLKLTPTQRLRKMDQFRDNLLRLRPHVRRIPNEHA